MSYFIVEGRTELKGDFYPQGNKNEALPILASVLLSKNKLTIHNIPQILDVLNMIDILKSLKVEVKQIGSHSFEFNASDIDIESLNFKKIRALRGSLTLLGPLLNRFHSFSFPQPGGDRIGIRKVDPHIHVFEDMGVKISYDFKSQSYQLQGAGSYIGRDILLDEASVTATESIIMLCVLAKGKTTLYNAACEPHVRFLCEFLNKMGAKIKGIGSNKIEIEGVERLGSASHKISSDYLEIGSMIALAAITNSQIHIYDIIQDNLSMILKFFEKLGVEVIYKSESSLVVPQNQTMIIQKDFHNYIEKIDDGPWPNFPADMISIMIVMATQCKGNVLFFEKMFESRLYFVDKLTLMGANIILCDPHRAVVFGPSRLYGKTLYSPDIRAGIALLIAAIAAEGKSYIQNIEQIDRGYEKIEVRLNQLGAKITRHD